MKQNKIPKNITEYTRVYILYSTHDKEKDAQEVIKNLENRSYRTLLRHYNNKIVVYKSLTPDN